MVRGAVLGGQLGMLGLHGGELSRELAEGGFGIFDAEVAGLVEGGEGFVDAGDGVFVGADIEVFDCVVDELR